MGDPTPLSLPPDLPYPITITRVVTAAGDNVQRGDRLLEYSFLSTTRRRDLSKQEREGKTLDASAWKDDFVGNWETPIAGAVVEWAQDIKKGATIDQRRGTKSVVQIEQPCTHPVQFSGMCAVCGASIDNDDYLSRPEDTGAGPSRYPGSFEVTHDASGVTVSTNEAKRLETMTRDSLLACRKLSLIVDLDQTIIHTTVDPTVGKWMEECAEDEKAENAEEEKDKTVDSGDTTTPPGSPMKVASKREKNPNAEALRDVGRFELPDDLPPGAPRAAGHGPMRGYFTKPRPGLHKFLTEQSQLYEMHVYTMGTRTYADAICKVIDPDGAIFGGRIISRDESRSMKTKSLSRLFPTDQSMVVIIDDRSDVWGDSPNLVKVVPYDFFIGIGDINGSFLPPTKPTISAPTLPSSSYVDSSSSAASSPMPGTPEEIPSTEDGLLRQSKILDEMTNARPLEQLEHEQEGDGSPEEDGQDTNASEAPAGDEAKSSDSPVVHNHDHKHRKALLNPNDHELVRVGNILSQIHSDYYTAYDSRNPSSSTLPMACDTPLLIQEIKDRVLSGCTIAFTGVIPQNMDPESSDVWRSTEEFGAICVAELSDKVTHLVTATMGTKKMDDAKRIPGIKVVRLDWLQSSIALWSHQPEGPFLVHQTSRSAAEPDSPKAKQEAEEARKRVEIDAAAALPISWDEDAEEDFDKWLDGDSEAGSEAGSEDSKGSNESSGDDEYHRWSRASTPARGILSRAGSRAPSPGPSRHVRYADEENLPLERVREPRPGEVVSYPPRKKRKLLMLGAPSDEDDVPEANKMVYSAKGITNGASSDDSDSDTATEGEDEFAKMLSDRLADDA